jgi:hypothetical protein
VNWKPTSKVSYKECMEDERPVMSAGFEHEVGKRKGWFLPNGDGVSRLSTIARRMQPSDKSESGSATKTSGKAKKLVSKKAATKADSLKASGSSLFEKPSLTPEPVTNKKGEVVGETPPLF